VSHRNESLKKPPMMRMAMIRPGAITLLPIAIMAPTFGIRSAIGAHFLASLIAISRSAYDFYLYCHRFLSSPQINDVGAIMAKAI